MHTDAGLGKTIFCASSLSTLRHISLLSRAPVRCPLRTHWKGRQASGTCTEVHKTARARGISHSCDANSVARPGPSHNNESQMSQTHPSLAALGERASTVSLHRVSDMIITHPFPFTPLPNTQTHTHAHTPQLNSSKRYLLCVLARSLCPLSLSLSTVIFPASRAAQTGAHWAPRVNRSRSSGR